MADTNTSSSTNGSTTSCADSLNETLIYPWLISFAISIIYIVLFSFLERRSDKEKCKCSGNRPGIIFPTNLLDHCDDRLSVAAAFGSMATYCFLIFVGSYTQNVPPWAKVLELLATVLTLGVCYYPLFASLFTKWVILGSCFGLVHSSLLFVLNLIAVVQCPDDETSTLPNDNIAKNIPILVCLLVLMLRFLYKITMSIITLIRNKFDGVTMLEGNHSVLATTHNLRHVKQLLTGSQNARKNTRENVETPGRLLRIKYFFTSNMYQNDPTFQYSPMIICIFTLSIICAYQFGITIVFIIDLIRRNIKLIPPDAGDSTFGNRLDIKLLTEIFEKCLTISFVCSSLLTLFMCSQILSSYRDSMRRMYRGDVKFLPFTRKDRKPQYILAGSFAYAGKQIAYILAGYTAVFVFLLMITTILGCLVFLPIFNRHIITIVVNILPGLLYIPAFSLILRIISNFLLHSRVKNETEKVRVLAIDNRKIYHNMQFFLFFFYIILGLYGSLMKILYGALLGLLYLPRVDKCGLISGFESFDIGHMNYVSFLHLEECHRHPVLLVFCQLLTEIDRKPTINVNNSLRNYSSLDDTPPFYFIQTRNQTARNRWQKAYTLLRNPSIRGDVVKPLENLTDKHDEIHESLHSVA